MEVRNETGDSAQWLFMAYNAEGDPQKFVKEKGWDPAVFALSPDIASGFHKGGIPATYFYDSSGKLVEKVAGPMNKEQLLAKVQLLQ